MNINEVRIGNWVRYNAEPVILDSEQFQLFLERNGEGYEPIPLTQDLMQSAGFAVAGQILGENQNLLILYKGLVPARYDVLKQEAEPADVHGLQNRYFDYTGEELAINPTL